MDPKEFNWKAEQQVVVTNPTSKNFKFQVHSKWYEVGSAKTVKMPGFIAWAYVYKLAVQMAVSAGDFDKWNEDGIHQKYYDKIVVSVEEVIQQVATVEEGVKTFESEDLGDDPLGDEDESTEDETEESEETGDEDPSNSGVKPMERRSGRPRKNRNS